jgi:hypothetical protein
VTKTDRPLVIGHDGATSCIHCARRGVRCHFSALPKPRRKSPSGRSTPESDGFDGLQSLFVDRLLSDPKTADARTRTNRIALQVSRPGFIRVSNLFHIPGTPPLTPCPGTWGVRYACFRLRAPVPYWGSARLTKLMQEMSIV